MNLSFKYKKLKKSLSVDKELVKTYGTRAKKIKQRMDELRAVENLATIQSIPQLRLHALTGDREGEWTIDIHKNWRICFTIDHNPVPTVDDGGIDLQRVTDIIIKSVEDPH